MWNVDIFSPFRFNQVVFAVFENGDEVGLVVAEVGDCVRVLDGEAESAGEFGELVDFFGGL